MNEDELVERIAELEGTLRSVIKANVYDVDHLGAQALGTGPTYAAILLRAASALPGDAHLRFTGSMEAYARAMTLITEDIADIIDANDAGDGTQGLALTTSPELADILERLLIRVGCEVVERDG